MKRQFFVLFIFIALTGFGQAEYNTVCDNFVLSSDFKVEQFDEHQFLTTFADRTIIYCSPDTMSNTLGFVHFNSTVTAIELIHRISHDSVQRMVNRKFQFVPTESIQTWYKINFKKGYGFVKQKDIADEKHPEIPAISKQVETNSGTVFRLKSIDSNEKSKQALDQIDLPFMHGYAIKIMESCALKNCEKLMVYETYRMSCPGSIAIHLVALTKRGFKTVSNSFSTGEANLYNSTTFYIPFYTGNDAIKLIADGELIRGNKDLSTVVGFPYPEEIGIPIDQLLVKKVAYTKEILDANGQLIQDDDHNFKVEEIEDEPVFYQWNGEESVELKSNYYLNRIKSALSDSTQFTLPQEKSAISRLDGRPIQITTKQTEKQILTPVLMLFAGLLIGSLFTFILLKLYSKSRNGR